jgi:hypothetical protein
MNGMIAALAVATGMLSQAPAPAWKSTYAEAYHAGKAARRPVLVVIDKPGDAAYRIDQVSLVRTDIGADEAALLASYELCHIDAGTPYGQDVAKRFGATQFPYVAITDKRVEFLLTQHTGRMSQQQWLATLAKYRTGEEPAPVVCFT